MDLVSLGMSILGLSYEEAMDMPLVLLNELTKRAVEFRIKTNPFGG